MDIWRNNKFAIGFIESNHEPAIYVKMCMAWRVKRATVAKFEKKNQTLHKSDTSKWVRATLKPDRLVTTNDEHTISKSKIHGDLFFLQWYFCVLLRLLKKSWFAFMYMSLDNAFCHNMNTLATLASLENKPKYAVWFWERPKVGEMLVEKHNNNK